MGLSGNRCPRRLRTLPCSVRRRCPSSTRIPIARARTSPPPAGHPKPLPGIRPPAIPVFRPQIRPTNRRRNHPRSPPTANRSGFRLHAVVKAERLRNPPSRRLDSTSRARDSPSPATDNPSRQRNQLALCLTADRIPLHPLLHLTHPGTRRPSSRYRHALAIRRPVENRTALTTCCSRFRPYLRLP